MPLTEPAGLVAPIRRELLGLEAVGPEYGLFAPTGHSLAAAHILARLGDATGAAPPRSAVLDAPTVAELDVFAQRRRA